MICFTINSASLKLSKKVTFKNFGGGGKQERTNLFFHLLKKLNHSIFLTFFSAEGGVCEGACRGVQAVRDGGAEHEHPHHRLPAPRGRWGVRRGVPARPPTARGLRRHARGNNGGVVLRGGVIRGIR